MHRIERVSLLLMGTLLTVGLAGCERPQAKVATVKPPMVVVAMPTTDYVTDYEDFTGRTDAILSVEIRARVTGYLDKVYFKDGDDVKEGDLLFEIDPRLYKADLDRAVATVSQNDAHFKRLDADFTRAKKLIDRGNIGREEFDKIFGDRAEAEASLGVSKAALDYAKFNDEFTRVRAPFSGRMSRRMVDPGNLVQADLTPLSSIVSQDPLYVYWDVDERTLLRIRRLIQEGKVKSRTTAEVPVMCALSDEDGYPHQGLIDFSDNKVDPSTGTLRLRAKIDNPKMATSSLHLLSPGLFMKVRLPVGSPRKSILIPEEALGTDQGKKFVYVVNKDKKINKRSVEVGKLEKGLRVINQGLGATEEVVVSGLQRIREGIEVNPQKVADVEKTKAKVAAAHTASTPHE